MMGKLELSKWCDQTFVRLFIFYIDEQLDKLNQSLFRPSRADRNYHPPFLSKMLLNRMGCPNVREGRAWGWRHSRALTTTDQRPMASTRSTSRNNSQITGNDQFRDSRVTSYGDCSLREQSCFFYISLTIGTRSVATSGMRNSFVMKQGLKQAIQGLFQPVLKYFL